VDIGHKTFFDCVYAMSRLLCAIKITNVRDKEMQIPIQRKELNPNPLPTERKRHVIL
jgi:hypothetical protein